MPLDLKPVPGGNVEIVDGVVHVVTAQASTARRVSHFATCPEAGKFRRRKPAEAST